MLLFFVKNLGRGLYLRTDTEYYFVCYVGLGSGTDNDCDFVCCEGLVRRICRETDMTFTMCVVWFWDWNKESV